MEVVVGSMVDPVSVGLGAAAVSGTTGRAGAGCPSVEPSQGRTHEYGLIHGPRPQITHRSLAASAHDCIENRVASGDQPRRPNSPVGAKVPESALSWNAHCESSRVRAFTVTASKRQPLSRDAM